MSFRDDHEATIVRAEAVTAELDRTRARLAVTTAERAELMAEVTRLRMLVPAPVAPSPRRSRSGQLMPRDWVIGLAIGFVPVLAMLAIIGAAGRGHETAAEDDDACTLRSHPAGATVHELPSGRQIGETPMTRERQVWNAFTVDPPYYELRLDGYRTAQVPPPLDRSGCDDRVLELQPLE